MRRILAALLLALPGQPAAFASQAAPGSFQVLAYHDVRDVVQGDYDPDQYAISTGNLIDQFTWLRLNGYTAVSIDDILAAESGERPLPDKAVLITFDDGFRSVATHVVPLLELFDYPAVISIVTSWIESDPGVVQAGRTLTHEDFLTWDQVRELAANPLIELASHSHDLHRGIVGNPQGNEEPAAATFAYADGRYESIDAFRDRIRRDLAASVEALERETGRRPRVMTWPYGAFNEITRGIAADLGMRIDLTLTDGAGSLAELGAVPRHLVEANPNVRQLAYALLHPPWSATVRAAQVDLDYVYDPDPVQQEQNLGRLLDRIKALGISHVYLQAFADPDADGGAEALYFPNRYLPMRADLFNRAAWQLMTRANVRVYAWLPVLSFAGDGIDPDWRILQSIDGVQSVDEDSEPRLSPFSAEARELINGIYADLARYAAIDGILFHDDGRMNHYEDASPAAMAVYRQRFGADFTFDRLEEDPALRTEWARLRSDAIVDLTTELTQTVRRYRPMIRTVRNMFATTLLEPEPELNLAQNYGEFLDSYDQIAIMAMPRFEGYNNHGRFYRDLAALAATRPEYRDKVVFELQTVDWRTETPIDSGELRDTMRMLQSLGIRNLAYYPENFIDGQPALEELKQGISLADFPSGASR
jgi:biofilm PGA synthesis lipoprotein PgaB